MKSVYNISIIIILIGAITAVPISKHLCKEMMTQTSMSHCVENHCCGHEDSLSDCCHDEIHDFTVNNIFKISFSDIETGKLSDFWSTYINSNLNIDYDVYRLKKRYHNLSIITPKNEKGLYRYVQSYLL